MAVCMNIQYPAYMERAAKRSIRTPEDRQEYRRSLHKSSGSPAWKSTYRQVSMAKLLSYRLCVLTGCPSLRTHVLAMYGKAESKPRKVPVALQARRGQHCVPGRQSSIRTGDNILCPRCHGEGVEADEDGECRATTDSHSEKKCLLPRMYSWAGQEGKLGLTLWQQ